jgi:prephenate dehydrogenase
MRDLDDFTIAIVGLGLMGGSLAMALKQQRVGRCVQGMDANPYAVERALQMGVIDAPCTDISAANFIVLAMPVRAIVAWLAMRGAQLAAETIVMDLGSTKQVVINLMASLSAQGVGGHPMCGKETSGIVAADANLFHGAKFVLTPTARTTSETLNLMQTVITRIGAQPIIMDAATHDRAVAAISHLPYLLSANLVNVVDGLHDKYTMLLAASGYQSTTRLAASDTRMMSDIIATNRDHIVQLLDAYQAELAQLRHAIANDEEAMWRERLEQARKVKSEK